MNREERDKRWAKGEGYNRYITSELNSFRKEAWKQQLTQHFPDERILTILDVGTGPGFFSCILAEMGHKLTGIDASDGMLSCARENARLLNVNPEFRKMDVNELTFEDESFDVLVMRNVTWTLEFPEKVYAEFKRLLKPGGKLLIYDANWHMHFFDEEIMKRVRQREEQHFQKYGTREIVSGGDLEYFKTAPLTRTIRPEWDEKVLGNLGFEVNTTENIGETVYEQWEKDLYGESPLFEICATKKEDAIQQTKMKEYWQERSKTFGFPNDPERLKEIGREYSCFIPDDSKKILDIGTGTGVISTSLALLGYEVTGVDLCSNMIAQAKKNSASMGVHVDFVCTAAGELPFEDNSFDVVVSRNVIWALPDPEGAVKQWKRVLKPGGMLIYQDGNHYLYHYDEKTMAYRKLYGEIKGALHGDDSAFDPSLCDTTAIDLPMSVYNRPFEWDNVVLPRLGFDIVAENIRMPQNYLKYGIARGYNNYFTIAAVNGK